MPMKNPHKYNTRIGSSQQHQFSEVPHADIQRSTFDRSHGLKTTFNAGQLVPIYVDEALPGDTFSCNLTAFSRLSVQKATSEARGLRGNFKYWKRARLCRVQVHSWTSKGSHFYGR